MLKSFLNINQQIELLESRGLIINHRDETANYLLSNNYYNIINGNRYIVNIVLNLMEKEAVSIPYLFLCNAF